MIGAVIYKLCLDTIGMDYEIRVNDIIIDVGDDKSSIDVEYPINQYLIEGANVITLQLIKELDIDYSHKVSILRADSNNYSINKTLNSFLISPESLKTGLNIQTFNFFLKLPFKAADWVECNKFDINNSTDYRLAKKIFLEYYNCLKTKNILGILNISKHKNQNLIRPYNRDQDLYIENIKISYAELLEDPDYRLWPLEEQEIIPKLYGGGKLLKFVNEQNTSALIMFNESESICSYYDIYIGKTKQDGICIVL
ncbi:MAG: hypothetical protein ABIO79_11200 [Ferruginibacter sp.]